MKKYEREPEIHVIPHPGKDEYRVTISLSIDGLEMTEAKDRSKLIRSVLIKAVQQFDMDTIVGMICLAKLKPKDRRRQLIESYIEQATRECRLVGRGELQEHLRKHGVDL